MIPGICPTTGKKCEFFTEWCNHEGEGALALTTHEIVKKVEVMAKHVQCHDAYVGDSGPVEPACAAGLALTLISLSWLDKQG